MAIIRGRQMGLDMPTLAKQFKTSKSVIWAQCALSTKLTWLPGVQGHCQKTSAQRWTLQKGPSEQANDSGEEPFSSTEVGKGSSALEWNKVLWSDESKYLMIGTGEIIHVRRPVDKRYDPKYQVPTVEHCGGNVMVWGCFHANGVGPLIRITEIMNRYMYKDILEKEMLPYGRFQMGRGWLFQQDNDPKHTSHFVKDWFAQRRTFEKQNGQKLYREVRATQGRMDQDPTSDPDELDRVHAKRCEAVIKAKSMATKY
uniref:Uncharacterized protein n=1 Tax=Caenorhabditis japonica TaxID=281687 RepID=A0A8R1HID5_CAEJA